MTAAFDTIKRSKLIAILETIVDEDELRIRVLLSNTTLEIKVNSDEIISVPFNTNVGSPQGDGLSGKLFTIYFEASLRKLREEMEKKDTNGTWIFSKRYPNLP